MELNIKSTIIIACIISLLVLEFILLILTPFPDLFNFLIRFAALFGFTSMFLATATTPFMVELYKIFGKSFIKIHHLFSISGLVLITVHPVAFAISVLDITVFIPVLFPWDQFWTLAGRPALIIIYIAVLAAILRKKFPDHWRLFHFLNYIALFFGYVHGILIGTDFQNPGIFILFTAMIIVSFVTFGVKRYKIYKRKQKLKQRKTE